MYIHFWVDSGNRNCAKERSSVLHERENIYLYIQIQFENHNGSFLAIRLFVVNHRMTKNDPFGIISNLLEIDYKD